ncbi:tetratricopeptide repeat protein [Candidatus Poribacteria bacterium]|nr:tetratricopeptide repeat protein [Candidatus Poribacteria bacterium]
MKPMRFGAVILTAIIIIAQYACMSSGTKQAEKLIEEKDYQGAIDVYQGGVQSKPGTPDARRAQLAIGKLYIEKMNKPEPGVQAYQEVTSAAPDSEEAAEAYYRLGVYYLKAKEYESAQKSFDAVINKFPNIELSHNAQLLLAKSYEEAKNYKQAAEIYDNFAQRNPKSERAAQALVNKARIQKDYLKDETEAKRTYQSLVKQYGKVEGAQEEISEAKRELQLAGASIPEPEDPLATQYGRARERQQERIERDRPRGGVERSPAMGGASAAADSGFGVSADEIMREFGGAGAGPGGGGGIQSDEQGTYYDAMLMIANMSFDSESYRDAGALYFRAIELARNDKAQIDPYSYLRLSICYRKLGMHQRADEVLKQAVRSDQKVLESVITTGTNQYVNEEYEKAIETYNSILGLNPAKDAEIYWRLSLVYKKMGDSQKEVEALERAVAAKTDYTDALQSLAEVLYYRLKDQDRAGIFQDLADAKGNTYAGETELATLCYKYGNYTWAKSKYEAAARIAQRQKKDAKNEAEGRALDNQIVYARVHAAMATFKLGDANRAQEAMDALAAEYPDHALIPYGRGQLALLKGDKDAAIADFKASMEKAPSSNAAPIALGEYYVSQGYADEAVALWEEFLKSNPSDPEVRQRLNALKAKASGTTTSN